MADKDASGKGGMLAGRRGTGGGLSEVSEVSDGDLTGTGGGGGGVTTVGRVVAGEEHDVPADAVEGLDATLAIAWASAFSAAARTGRARGVFADSEGAWLLEGDWFVAGDTAAPGKGLATGDTYAEWMGGRCVRFGSGVVDRSEDDRELVIGLLGGGGETGIGRGFGIGGKSSLLVSSGRAAPALAPLPS